MNLKNFLSSDNILLHLSASNQIEMLTQLIAPMIKSEAVAEEKTFLQDLLRREGEITTVIEHGVAIPHARSIAVRRLSLVVGLTDENGVAFNPDSDINCSLFFCIAIPSFAPTSHLPLLQLLAAFAHNSKRLEKLVQCKTPRAVSKILCAFKG